MTLLMLIRLKVLMNCSFFFFMQVLIDSSLVMQVLIDSSVMRMLVDNSFVMQALKSSFVYASAD